MGIADGELKSINPPLKGILQTNKIDKNRMVEEEKSDFFEKNDPLKSKSKRFAGDFLSDESDGNDTQVIVPRTKAWQQQINDSGSDADVDEEPQIVEMKSRGWKQKVAKSNVT